ncbi:MAG: HlyD family type I secretion periplasmic adaptor subunit [Moraxellaceae bacterium]|nr:HlyD family type I secretion periplasmic adaptor subunit [Moraxellaceae bacterium]
MSDSSLNTQQRLQQLAHDNKPARWGRYSLLTLLAIFILWGSFMPIDSGVPAQGVIGIQSQRQSVQHPQGGVVKHLFVHEGMYVAQGQQLLALDNTQINADLQRAEQEYIQYSARLVRLLAERQHQAQADFRTQTALQEYNNPIIISAIQTQSALLKARVQGAELEQKVLQQRIAAKKIDSQRQQTIATQRQQQIDLLKQEIQAQQALIKQGFMGQERLLSLQREQLERQVEQNEAQLAMSQQQADIAELTQQILLKKSQYQQEIEREMTEVEQQLVVLTQQKNSLQDRLQHTQITAPASGVVVAQTIHTQGGVISAGQVLMDIVPTQNNIMVDAKVAPHLIEKIQLNQTAHIRLTALDSLNPVVEATVISISADQLTPNNNTPPYFAVRLQINTQSLQKVKYQKISAGMPVDVLFKTGERSFFRYLAEPLLKTFFFALRE